MVENSTLFIGLGVSKDSHAVAVAESGRKGEVSSYGEIGADAVSVRRFVRNLERPNTRLRFCYEAGPTGYRLKRQIKALGHDCAVIAPSVSGRPLPLTLRVDYSAKFQGMSSSISPCIC